MSFLNQPGNTEGNKMKYYQLNIYTKYPNNIVQAVIDEVMQYLLENGLGGCFDKSKINLVIDTAWEELAKGWKYFKDFKDNIVVTVEETELEE